MNETSRILVKAASDGILAQHASVGHPLTVETVAAVATAAVLRKLAILMNTAEIAEIAQAPSPVGEDWPDAGDLTLLARDIRESL